MPTVYITEQGSKLHIQQNRLRADREQTPVVDVPLDHIEDVVLMGGIEITTPCIKRLLRDGQDVIFMTQRGGYAGRISGPLSRTAGLRYAQYQLCADPAFSLPVAGMMIAARLRNMRALLNNRDTSIPAVSDAIDALTDAARRTEYAVSGNALMGLEGAATRAYWRAWAALLPPRWGFTGRKRRPPTDPANVLLSLGYTLLTNRVVGAVEEAGLDPYVGVLHGGSYGQPSLALDLIEELRAPIVDVVVMRCLVQGIVSDGDFSPDPDQPRRVVLGKGGFKAFITAFEGRLHESVQHLDQQTPFWRMPSRQARLLAAAIRATDPGLYRPYRSR